MNSPWPYPRRTSLQERAARNQYVAQAVDLLKRARHHATEAMLADASDDTDVDDLARIERALLELYRG